MHFATSLLIVPNWNVRANDLLPFESSANEDELNLQCLKARGCDLTLMLNSFGPRTDPCGAPHGTSRLSEYVPLILTLSSTCQE